MNETKYYTEAFASTDHTIYEDDYVKVLITQHGNVKMLHKKKDKEVHIDVGSTFFKVKTESREITKEEYDV